MTNIADNSDDFERLVAKAHHQTLTERLFIGESLLHQRFAHDQDLRALAHLLWSEITTAENRYVKSAKVLVIYPTKIVVERLIGSARRATFDREGHVIRLPTQRQLADHADGFHTGYRSGTTLKLLPEAGPTFRGGVLLLRQIYPHRDDVARIETGIDALQSDQASDQQAGAHQQHYRNCGFENYQQAARPVTLAGFAAPAAVFQSLTQIHSHRVQGGSQTEQDTADDGSQERKE